MRKMLIVVILMLAAPLCFAQRPGSVELTPFAGYWLGDTLLQGYDAGYPFDIEIDDAPAYGLRLAYRFHDNWGLEWGLYRNQADLVGGGGSAFADTKVGEIDIIGADINFEATFGHSRMRPFLIGGIGVARLDPDLAGLSSDTQFVGNFGAGFKLFFSPEFAFRFDWRAHSINVGDGDSECDWWDCDYESEWTTLNELSVGFTFVF